jgi:tRNA(Ile)-lysidine synthase
MTTKRATGKSRSPRLSKFATTLLEEWRRLKLPMADAKVVVAVSGGADSTALLLAINELILAQRLQATPVVAHLDHGLRKQSRDDARWVASLSKQLGYESAIGKRDVKKASSKRKENLEDSARKARYDFLRRVAQKRGAKHVLTAHTLDDQAETVLLRLLRGSAAEGLSGTPLVRPLNAKSDIQLVRPLLGWARRSDTEEHCRFKQVAFLSDEMNADESFSRVRVRKQLLPLMQSFNNRIVETLSRTAMLLGEDASALSDAANRLIESATGATEENETRSTSLNVDTLLRAPAAVRRRVIREWILRGRGDLKRLEMVHLLAVEKLLVGDKGGRVAELPGGMTVTRRRGILELSAKKRLKKASSTSKIPAR